MVMTLSTYSQSGGPKPSNAHATFITQTGQSLVFFLFSSITKVVWCKCLWLHCWWYGLQRSNGQVIPWVLFTLWVHVPDQLSFKRSANAGMCTSAQRPEMWIGGLDPFPSPPVFFLCCFLFLFPPPSLSPVGSRFS